MTLSRDTSPRRLGRRLVALFRRGRVRIFQRGHRLERRRPSLRRQRHVWQDDDDDGRGSVRVIPLKRPPPAPWCVDVCGRGLFLWRRPLPRLRRRDYRKDY